MLDKVKATQAGAKAAKKVGEAAKREVEVVRAAAEAAKNKAEADLLMEKERHWEADEQLANASNLAIEALWSSLEFY